LSTEVSADLAMTRREKMDAWIRDLDDLAPGYRPIESQGCLHFLSAKQLHTARLAEFRVQERCVEMLRLLKIIFPVQHPSVTHHSSPLSRR
jgi:hypothetical protein